MIHDFQNGESKNGTTENISEQSANPQNVFTVTLQKVPCNLFMVLN